VDSAGATYEQVKASVDGVLASSLPDVAVTLVGPWSRLTASRRSPLDDPWLDERLMKYAYEHDGRVRLVEAAAGDSAPAMFRLTLPAGWAPGPETLRRLVAAADENAWGLVCLALAETDEVVAARFERTAALTRARHLRTVGEDLDEVVDQVFGVHWVDGAAWGFAGP
jgi:hypothetical protein